MSTRPARLLPLVAALALSATAVPALAQGTAEQQEACAPDAFKFCSAAIPDVPKTTACMKAHVAQLSSRCRAAFNEATGPKSRVVTREERARVATREERREERRAPRADLPSRAPEPDVAGAMSPPAPELGPLAGYRAQIAQSCREGLIDPFTCRNTLDVLGGAD